MIVLIILLLIGVFLIILDVNIFDIIPAPKSKFVFIFFALLSVALLVLSVSPGLIISKPSGIYKGNLEAQHLMTGYKQSKTYLSISSFGALVILMSLSPFWYRLNARISKIKILKFSLIVILVGTVLGLSFFPEIVVGQRPWVNTQTDKNLMFADYAEWNKKRGYLSQLWMIAAVILILRRKSLNEKIDKIFDFDNAA